MTPRLALLGATLMISVPAIAAEVSTRKLTDQLMGIAILGDIKADDAEKFRRISLEHKTAVVLLESNGGSLIPAIEIGKLIRMRGYSTLVVDDSTCTSSCALIWLAGSTRWMAPRARVGFHASYRDRDGKMEESGVGNALVGNYLTLLNLPERAIVFATTASPTKISWLSASNSSASGIDFKEFIISSDAPVTNKVVSKPLPPPRPPAPKYKPNPTASTSYKSPKWTDYADDVNGTRFYLDSNSVREIGSLRMVWIKKDHSKNRTISHRYSMEYWTVDCKIPRLLLQKYVDYDKNGADVSSGGPGTDWQTAVPESVGMAMWEAVCMPDEWVYSGE